MHLTPTTHVQTKILRELIFWLIYTTLKSQKIHISNSGIVFCSFGMDCRSSSFQSHQLMYIYSDASSLFGCGAFGPGTGWFQLQWLAHWSSVRIAVKEMVPVVVAAALWGKLWEGCHICFHSDNMAVLAVLNKHTARDEHLLHFLCCLFFYASYYKFYYSASHIPGTLNAAADALSRNVIQYFVLSFVSFFSSLSVLCLSLYRDQQLSPYTLVPCVSTKSPWEAQTHPLRNGRNCITYSMLFDA